MRKRMISIILILLACLLVFGCSTSVSNDNNPILDVTQFNKVSEENLIEIMGDPVEVEEWNFDSLSGNSYPVTTYFYEGYEFLVIDDIVVRLNILKEIGFKNEKDIFKLFGITNIDKTKKIADTGYVLRYSPVSDEVQELWIINIKDKKFDNAKITYELKYFK